MTARAPSPRVLLLVPNLVAGGAETQIALLAEGLAQRGFAVTLAAQDEIGRDVGGLQAAGVRLLALGARSRSRRAALVPALARLARAHDVVHCGLWDASLWGRVAALLARRPVTVGEHSSERSLQLSAAGRPRARWIAAHHRALGPVTFATVACVESQRALLAAEGVPPRRIAVIPNGIPLTSLRRSAAAAPRAAVRAALGIADDALVLCHVARVAVEKNQRATVDAVDRLREAHGNVHAVFAGAIADRAAPDRAAALGADWAHFLGPRDDVPALLGAADLAVLPSRTEALPMAMLEAMALGVPQVVSDVGDMGAIIRRSGAGTAVEPGDLEAFAAACDELLGDADRRAAVAAVARAESERWDVGAMVDSYAELLREAACVSRDQTAQRPRARAAPGVESSE